MLCTSVHVSMHIINMHITGTIGLFICWQCEFMAGYCHLAIDLLVVSGVPTSSALGVLYFSCLAPNWRKLVVS